MGTTAGNTGTEATSSPSLSSIHPCTSQHGQISQSLQEAYEEGEARSRSRQECRLSAFQRNASISASMASTPRGSAGAAVSVPAPKPAAGFEGKLAIEQRAAKLILEAEKRGLQLQQGEGQDDGDEDVEMDAHSFMAARAAAGGKKKAGASGLKARVAKRKVATGGEGGADEGDAAKPDYVDLFDGRRPKNKLVR